MPTKAKPGKRSFWVLMAIQFLGVANDNALKGILTFLVVDGLWSSELGSGGQAIIFVIFTLPFLLFSGAGGPLADRKSKTALATRLKGLEIPIALVSAYAFYVQNLWLAMAALFLLTTQSAYFGPVKYGMIPELLSEKELARGNGLMNMATNVSAVMATKLGGEISDLYDPVQPAIAPQLWLPGAWLLGMAVLGWICSLFFEPLAPATPDSRERFSFFSAYIQSAKAMRKGPLGQAVLLWTLFYVVATIALLIVPEYATVLSISRGHAADLLVVISIAIAVGSVGAGMLARQSMGMHLVPWGAAGMALTFVAMAVMPPSFVGVAACLAVAGLCAGAFIVPLQAKMQALAPASDRGRFLGSANAFSFGLMALAAVAYKFIRPLVGDAPYLLFGLCALMMVAALVMLRVRRELFDDLN